MKVTRRILSKQTNIAQLASKSRKLASVQRILSDIQEFLVEYLNEGKLLTRSTAKSAYKNFHDLIVDGRTSGLKITLSETEFDHAWGTSIVVEHFYTITKRLNGAKTILAF